MQLPRGRLGARLGHYFRQCLGTCRQYHINNIRGLHQAQIPMHRCIMDACVRSTTATLQLLATLQHQLLLPGAVHLGDGFDLVDDRCRHPEL